MRAAFPESRGDEWHRRSPRQSVLIEIDPRRPSGNETEQSIQRTDCQDERAPWLPLRIFVDHVAVTRIPIADLGGMRLQEHAVEFAAMHRR